MTTLSISGQNEVQDIIKAIAEEHMDHTSGKFGPSFDP